MGMPSRFASCVIGWRSGTLRFTVEYHVEGIIRCYEASADLGLELELKHSNPYRLRGFRSSSKWSEMNSLKNSMKFQYICKDALKNSRELPIPYRKNRG